MIYVTRAQEFSWLSCISLVCTKLTNKLLDDLGNSRPCICERRDTSGAGRDGSGGRLGVIMLVVGMKMYTT